LRPVRICGILAVAVILLAELMPGVLAQDFQTNLTRRVDLSPDTSAFNPNQVINLANSTDPSKVQLEKDVLNPTMMEVGKFLGPYVRSSKFRFTYDVVSEFKFSVVYNFTHEQLMSGSSTFWMRWPVDATEYASFCITIENFFDDGPFHIPTNTWYQRCQGGSYPDPMPGEIAEDSSGLYVKYYSYLFASRLYTFTFLGTLKPKQNPSVWLSMEKLQINNQTTFAFDDTVRGIHHTQTLSLFPAFAFNFLSGLAIAGLTSYQVNFDGTNGTFLVGSLGGAASTTTATDHVSIYLPFTAARSVKFTIMMRFLCVLSATLYYVWEYWTVSGVNHFLLTSTPDSVKTILDSTGSGCTWTTSGGIVGSPTIYIKADQPLVLLGWANPAEQIQGFQADVIWGLVIDGGTGPFTGFGNATAPPTFVSSEFFPVFINAQFTSGRWAAVTPGFYFTTYDFGWGRAFLFPGEVNLTMFLVNGTAIGFDSVLTIVSGPGANATECKIVSAQGTFANVADWINKLACFIVSLVGNIIGTISTVFQAIWGFLKQLGEWIYSALVGFVQFVVQLVTDLVDIATQIVFAMFTVLPFIVILLIAGKGLPDVLEGKSMLSNSIAGLKKNVNVGRERRIRHIEKKTARLERKLARAKEREKE